METSCENKTSTFLGKSSTANSAYVSPGQDHGGFLAVPGVKAIGSQCVPLNSTPALGSQNGVHRMISEASPKLHLTSQATYLVTRIREIPLDAQGLLQWLSVFSCPLAMKFPHGSLEGWRLLIKEAGEGIQYELCKWVYEAVSSSTLPSKLQLCSPAPLTSACKLDGITS